MFSLKIVDTDAFLEMPQSSQLLYYHLAMRADDDGFVSNPKKIMRMVGSQDDDYKILLAKRFVIAFDSGVCVIKHWRIHNLIRIDRYNETTYLKEKKTLSINDNGSYSDNNVIPNGNQMATQVRLGKVRSGKDNSEAIAPKVSEIIKLFESINPNCKRMYGNKTQRRACQELIDNYSFERVCTVIENTLPKTNKLQFFPTITTPLQLMDKWTTLESSVVRYQQEKINKNKVAF